ncbi:MAG: hypothetical protein KKA64_04720 [Nanoarchaeota archaeon]|nr:hypothetical protein [Nanoarchaeota archaeon]
MDKNIKKLVELAPPFLIFLFLINGVIADNSVKVEIHSLDSYFPGDIILFNYSFFSELPTNLSYFVGINCSREWNSFQLYKRLSLEPNKLILNSFDSFLIDSTFEPQTCTAYVQIMSPVQQTFSKNFSIVTDPSFSFTIKLDKKVFTQNEDIYIDYESSVANPSISAMLTKPNGQTQQVTLPATIKAEEIGTYNLDITASKQGYKTITKKEQFGVIEGEANIPDADFITLTSGTSGVSSGISTSQGIPMRTEEGKMNYIWIGIIVTVIILIIIIAFIIIYALKKRREQQLYSL